MLLDMKRLRSVIFRFKIYTTSMCQRILKNRARECRREGKEVRVGYKTIRIANKQFRWDEERQHIVETETGRTFRGGRKQ